MKRPSAFLMTRPDFVVRDIELPPVPEREIEGLIRYRLRSLYPGDPEETAFDYALTRAEGSRRRGRRAIVFIARKAVVDEYKAKAGRRPLALPFTLLRRMALREGSMRAWVVDGTWAEHILFDDGAPVSSVVKIYGRGEAFDLSREDAALGPEIAVGPPILAASEEALAASPLPRDAQAMPLERLLLGLRYEDGIFCGRSRAARTRAASRIAGLSVAALVLGILLALKGIATAESRADDLQAQALALEKSSANALSLEKDIERLKAESDRLAAATPRDAYLLFSALYRTLGDDARIQSVAMQDSGFQVDATGSNALRSMERFKEHPEFTGMKLAQVVPDAKSGRERFTFSGTFNGR